MQECQHPDFEKMNLEAKEKKHETPIPKEENEIVPEDRPSHYKLNHSQSNLTTSVT